MTAINYFVNQPKEWLEKELALCQEDISRGKTLTQWGAGESNGQSRVLLSPDERFARLYYALSQLDSDLYPPIQRASRTRASFQ